MLQQLLMNLYRKAWSLWTFGQLGGPCRMLAPILDEVADKLSAQAKFGKVDVDNAPDLAKRFEIRSIPNVCVFKDGVLVDRIIGLCDADELSATISKHIG